MFQGFLRFAGVEIANSARTAAYAAHLVPSLGFKDAWNGDSLPCLLGEGTYRTPILDPAPWFSEHRPASGKFLGFYPLSIEGVEDSSREINVTELSGDGAVFSLPRRASKEFRVTGLMIGEDQEGVDAGMRWLKGALEGSECSDGDCTGDSLCYLAYLPSCCNYSDESQFPRTPVDDQWVSGSSGGWVPYLGGAFASLTNGIQVNMPCGDDGVQYYAENLIPGQPYRLTLQLTSSSELVVSATGRVLDQTRRSNTNLDSTRTPWVYDFVALAEMETIRIVNASSGCTPASMRIYGIAMERTPVLASKFLPRFRWSDYTEPPSWSKGSVPANISPAVLLSTSGSAESLTLRWANTGGSTVTVPAGTYMRRLMRGLEVGRAFTVYLNVTGAGVDNPLPAFQVEGVSSTTTSLGSDWYAVTFTANSPQAYLRIKLAANVAVTTGQSSSLVVKYLRADIDTSRMAYDAIDQTEQATRTLHGVTLIDGPNPVEIFRDGPAALTRVEFSMAAARPFIYSDSFNIPLDPAATTFLVGTGSCKNGLPIRTNKWTNPFMVGATSAGIDSYAGLGVAACTLALVPNGVSLTPSAGASYMSPNVGAGAFLDGHTYTISADFSQDDVQTPVDANARRIVVISAGATIASEPAINTAGTQRVSVTFTHSGSAQPGIRFYNGSAVDVVKWGSFLVEEGGIAGAVFSGASANAVWTGTANQSTSKWTAPTPALITDPDCPPIPLAPQPPTIDPACPRDVSEWRRYWIEVPARLSGGWSRSVPTVTLTTRSNIVRDVRVRMYPNPNELGVEDVEPCSYCGEFYVSYIPKETVLTVDGIFETAIADVRGTGKQSVMHLVSDADYGPIRWPAMTCDMPYYVTVDIAPDEVLDVDVRLSVSLVE